MINISIQVPTVGDQKKIDELFKITINAAFDEQGLGNLTVDIAEEVQEKNEKLKSFLEDKGKYYFLIAKTEDVIVGTISFGDCRNIMKEECEGKFDGVGEIGSLYVLPKYQGQGIGAKLIDSLICQLKQDKIEYFGLESAYKKAQKKWTRKFGEPYKILRDYWGPNSDHYIWYCKVNNF